MQTPNEFSTASNTSHLKHYQFQPKHEKLRTKQTVYINNVILRKYLNQFPTGSWAEANTLVANFIKKGLTKSYCNSVLKRLIRYHKQHDLNYKSPLMIDSNLITNAYQNVLKLKYSNQSLYDQQGQHVTRHIVNISLPKIPMPIKHLRIMYIHSVLLLTAAFERQLLTLATLSHGQLASIELALLIYISYHIGSRIGELLNLTVANVIELADKQSAQLFCKGKLDRFIVPKLVSDMMYKYIKKRGLSSPSDFMIRPVYSKNQTVQTFITFRNLFASLYRRLFKVEKPLSSGFHNYRYYFAFRTEDKEFAQMVLRHISKKTFQRYLSVYTNQQKFTY